MQFYTVARFFCIEVYVVYRMASNDLSEASLTGKEDDGGINCDVCIQQDMDGETSMAIKYCYRCERKYCTKHLHVSC